MSILIRGMEMPKSCDSCRIMMLEDTNCTPELYCGCPIVFKAHPQGVGHRPDYCPLVPVPAHGDLIDKDATMNAILEERGEDTACWFAGIVNDMPAVIPSDKAEEGE